MIKKMFMFSVMAVLAAVVAHADPSQVYGKWQSSQAQNGIKFTIGMEISTQQTVFSNSCTINGETGTVSAAVPTQVTANQIVVTGSANASKNVGGLNCNLNIAPMQFDYTVNANTLSLSMSGQTIQFTKAN